MESSSSPWLLSTAARVPFLDESEIDFAEDHDGSSSDDAIVLDEQGSDRRRQQYLDHHLLFDPRRHLATLKDPSQNETASSSSTATTSDGTSFSYHPVSLHFRIRMTVSACCGFYSCLPSYLSLRFCLNRRSHRQRSVSHPPLVALQFQLKKTTTTAMLPSSQRSCRTCTMRHDSAIPTILVWSFPLIQRLQ